MSTAGVPRYPRVPQRPVQRARTAAETPLLAADAGACAWQFCVVYLLSWAVKLSRASTPTAWALTPGGVVHRVEARAHSSKLMELTAKAGDAPAQQGGSEGFRKGKSGAVVLARPVRASKTDESPRHSCPCGCGGFPKGTFLPGHDAKLKAKLIRAHVTGTKVVEVVEDKKRSPITAKEVASRFGWERFLDAAEQQQH